MRLNNLTLVMVGILPSVAGLFITAQSQPFEMIEIGTGADPHWSPDGTKLAYVYKNTLYITNSDGSGESEKIVELPSGTSGFNWLDSTEFVYWGRDQRREEGVLHHGNWTEAVKLNGMKRPIARDSYSSDPKKPHTVPLISSSPIFLDDGTVGYYELPVGKKSWDRESRIFKVIKQGKLPPDSSLKQCQAVWYNPAIFTPEGQLYPDGGIGIESVDGKIKKQIVKGVSYSFPELSPDGTRILTSCKGCGSMCIMDLEGNETCMGKKGVWPTKDGIDESCMGPPFAKWSPDSKKIAYAYVKSKILDQDGQMIQTIGSEIHIVNVETSEDLQITNTPDIHEGNLVWSPDGTRIACVDGATSKIYLIKLE